MSLLLWLLASICNGLMKYPKTAGIAHVVLDAISFLTRSNAPGTLKIPLLQASASPGGSSNGAPTKPGVAAAIVLVLACGTMPGCKCTDMAINVAPEAGVCALKQVSSIVDQLLPMAVNALRGTPNDWNAFTKDIEINHGIGLAFCIAGAAIDYLMSHSTSVSIENPSSPEAVAIARAKEYQKALLARPALDYSGVDGGMVKSDGGIVK